MHSHVSYCVNFLVSKAKRRAETILLSSKGDSKPNSAVETEIHIVNVSKLFNSLYRHPRSGGWRGRRWKLQLYLLLCPRPLLLDFVLCYFFPYVPSFIPLSLHLQESNLWKGRKYTLYRSQALELPDLISLVDVVD